jgi:hypothetical protein
MNMNCDLQETLKQNAINLVKHHKEHCHSPDCGVSVFLIEKLIREAGIELTEEESAIFI